MLWRRAGLLAAPALLPVLLGACSAGPVAVEVPDVPESQAEACRELVDELPAEVVGQERREVAGGDGRAAAWGDPAVVLRCGVPEPVGFAAVSTCIEANGTAWFVPDDVLLSDDETLDVTMTAVEVRPRVEVVLPGDYRPEGFANAAARIGAVVADRLEQVSPCSLTGEGR